MSTISPPEPVLSDHYRVQMEFQLASLLPEDRIVSVFNMRNDAVGMTQEDSALQAADAIREFYFEPVGTIPALCGWLNGVPIASAQMKVYDLGQAPPRAPVVTVPVAAADLGKMSTAGGGPFEVAACISWQTAVVAPRTGTPGKTGRGRTYLGPLTNTAFANTSLGYPILNGVFRDSIAASAQRLLQRASKSLVVLSRKYATSDEIIGGYIDDAPDTQRRRGQKPSSRIAFTA